MTLVFRYAGRELRNGFSTGMRGFRIFLACLTIGVAAIAGIGSITAAVERGLAADSRLLLGGDVELRLPDRGLPPDEVAWLHRWGRVSEIRQQRAMLRRFDNTRSALVELKSVDDSYPLYGAVTLSPPLSLRTALASNPADADPPILADPILLAELGVRINDRVRLGDGIYRVAAELRKTPDGGISAFGLGPPAMVGLGTLGKAGLDQTGTIATHIWRLRLSHGDGKAFAAAARQKFPDETWQIRDISNASPALSDALRNIGGFLTLVGLTALLVGGIGIANAVSAHLDSRARTIAILKALGAPVSLTFWIYLAEILAIAGIGILAGLAIGSAMPLLAKFAIGDWLQISIDYGPYPAPLGLAAVQGLLTTLVFSLWPLRATREVPAAALLRAERITRGSRPVLADRATIAALAIGLGLVTVLAAADRGLAIWFSIGILAALLIFRLAGMLVARLARLVPAPRDVMLRQAIANLHRPGAPTVAIVTSLGLGLTVLVTVAEVQGSLTREVSMRIPARAPGYFFIDIQPDELATFKRVIAATPGVSGLNEMPNLRTRITAINGVPADKADIDPSAKPILNSERGLTYSAGMPPGTKITAGSWWPADYRGPPEISLDGELARNLHVGLGGTMSFDIAGRTMTARIVSLRKIDWSSLEINFFTIFAPGTLEQAPQTHLATVFVNGPAAEAALRQAVTTQLPNVSAIRVRDALERVAAILNTMAAAIRAVALIAVVTGMLVLAGAVAAGQRRHVKDAVILKVLGASRAMLARGLVLQYAMLGGATAMVAIVFGMAAAGAILHWGMHLAWAFLPSRILGVGAVGIAFILLAGVAGTWRAISMRPASFLREN